MKKLILFVLVLVAGNVRADNYFLQIANFESAVADTIWATDCDTFCFDIQISYSASAWFFDSTNTWNNFQSLDQFPCIHPNSLIGKEKILITHQVYPIFYVIFLESCDVITSIDRQFSSLPLKLFPNPASEKISLELPPNSGTLSSVVISDIAGRYTPLNPLSRGECLGA